MLGGGGSIRLGQRELMIGGAVVVAGLALYSRSRAGGDVTDDGGEEGSAGGFEIDTRNTDFYNELQPELEALPGAVAAAIAEQQAAKPPAPSPKPPPPKPGPKAGTTARYLNHLVRKGETLTSIARKYKTTRSAVYKLSKEAIELAARSHGRKSSQAGRFIYPGTTLRVPNPNYKK